MTTRTPALAAAAVSAALASAVLLPGISSGQDASDPLRFTIDHREARVTMIDEAPRMRGAKASESPGDSVVTRAPVRDASGARIGRMHSTFLVTGGRSPKTTELMTGMLVLADGQLAVQGVFDNSRDTDTDTIAVTGGSGRYAGASGELVITSGPKAVGFELRLAP